MPTPPIDVAQQLAQMREAYGVGLRVELAELADWARGESGNCQNVSDWQPIRDRLHKIAGGSSTFGFVEIGQACRSCERELDAILKGRAPAVYDTIIARMVRLPELLADPEPDSQGGQKTVPGFDGVVDEDEPLIYILEDEPETGAQLMQILESFDYRAELFDNGPSLRAACRSRRPDALILDLHFADREAVGGLAVGEAIQAEMETPLPLFASEQSAEFDVQLRAVRAGVVGFLAQPLDPIRVTALLESHMRAHRAAPLRVLMVDDDESMLAYHRLVLESAGFTVKTLSEPDDTLAVMERFNPDVLVLDVRMPRCSGPELAQMVRYHSRWLQMPIMYLSAIEDANAQLEAMTKAGDDFLIKPITPNAFVASVQARARRARELSMALSRDSLTGLLKHADIKERIASALSQARRRAEPIAVVMLDIDFFKRVNDTYGHLVGDEVIRALANLLRRRLRTSDLLGRYGGEEFIVALPGCGTAKAVEIIDELRESFTQFQFTAGSETFSSSFSAGVKVPDGDEDLQTLIAAADARLYAAKNAGRNRVVGADMPAADPQQGRATGPS
ncbi:diguanylate cyclase [Salinisphaera sp.]|uniref:diguanylate cyclase n=1 Tax=Salinisphaera sp. TaxID=1914330 RepID=UPI000C593EAA|nr:diguanylate cyclase [Salinisphaera sp.]MBS63783.1 diguanylate cyclase [Salinisphaera sp.]